MESIQDLFRESMGRLASGVSIVTTEVNGRPWGLTISACASISMEPTLLMISIFSNTAAANAISEQKKFGVCILGDDQIEIAKAGARKGETKYFEEYALLDETATTYAVPNALSHIYCELYKTVIAGDHTIFIGEAKSIKHGTLRSPLMYYNRQFGTFNNELSVEAK